ncbi:MAG TPA: hypothetical protein VMH01_04325 [Puia sp.]|nr:hypothetical protein [Puia sp.]
MRKAFLLIVTICLFTSAYNQTKKDDEKVSLDLLRAPSSPGSNLLGFSPSDIEKPTDISSFMISLQTAANSLVTFPSNYAVDIAPYWLLSKKGDYTTAGLNSQRFNDIFKQSFVLSAAIKNPDSSETSPDTKSSYASIGFKFSVLRGSYDEKTQESLNTIGALQYKINHTLEEAVKRWINTDPKMISLKKKREDLLRSGNPEEVQNTEEYKRIDKEINDRLESFTEQKFRSLDLAALKKEASSFKITRVGWSWDISGGLSAEFINKQFDNSKINNAGIWTTFGYAGRKGSTFLGLIRYLYNPDRIYAKNNTINHISNISTMDAGLRYVYTSPQSKFDCSMEAIYRSVLSSNTIDPSWKLVFNADYSIWDNQKISFSFGRNFDGTITKSGNLIAALTFLAGFGNKR